MNTFTKSALTLLAASSIASVALAAPGDARYGNSTRSQVQTNTSQVDSIDVSVDTNAAFAPTIKASNDMDNRADFLQNKLN